MGNGTSRLQLWLLGLEGKATKDRASFQREGLLGTCQLVLTQGEKETTWGESPLTKVVYV